MKRQPPKRSAHHSRHADSSVQPCHVCGLKQQLRTLKGVSNIVAESPAMSEVLKRAALFARGDAPVVVLGESGSGKEIVARTLHANSTRADKPFVAVNVAALPAELLESELFGHARGAFTGASSSSRGLFEEAEGGVLFLDEIAEMPLALQAKMLRALQDGEIRRIGETRAFVVDTRIICATHRDLREYTTRGLFREDLFYRLSVLTLRVPPLRQRKEDIIPLAHMFLAQEQPPSATLSPAAEKAMLDYAWPGNVRELSNAVKHGAVLAQWRRIEPEHLPETVLVPHRPEAFTQLKTLAEMESDYVKQVLEACGGSQVEAARVLGVGRTTLWRKLRGVPG